MKLPHLVTLAPAPQSTQCLFHSNNYRWKEHLGLMRTLRLRFEKDIFHLSLDLSMKMRLLTHNMLMSNIKGVKNGYPLLIEVKYILFRYILILYLTPKRPKSINIDNYKFNNDHTCI